MIFFARGGKYSRQSVLEFFQFQIRHFYCTPKKLFSVSLYIHKIVIMNEQFY